MPSGMVCVVSWWAWALVGSPPGIALVESGSVAPDLQQYLRDRLNERFGEGDEPGQFRVVLDGVKGELSITEGERPLARRSLPSRSEDAPTAWIFVRSTLERALTRADPTPPIPVAAERPRPTAPAPAPIRVRSQVPEGPRPRAWSIHGVLGPQLSDSTPSLGFRVGAHRALTAGLRLGLESGYRYGSPTAAFARHGVPLQLRAGWTPSGWPVELGLLSGIEVVLASAQRTSALTVDVEAGTFAKVATPLYDGPRGQLDAVVEGAAAVALRRASYTIPAGELEDALWRLRLSAGVEWRWL